MGWVRGTGCASSQGREVAAVRRMMVVVGVLGCSGTQVSAPGPGVPVEVDYEAPRVQKTDRPGWVRVHVTTVAPDDEAPTRARARAMARARAAACEFVSGVTVRSGVLSFEAVRDEDSAQLIESLTAVFSEAVVVDERVESERIASLAGGGGFRVEMVLLARVVDRRGPGSDPGFQVEVRLPRETFLDGDDLEVEVRSTRDTRLYVLSIYKKGAVLLLPNEYVPDAVARAGEWVKFPGPALRERGVRVQARLPEGAKSSPESLVVIALRGDRGRSVLRPRAGEVFREAEASGAGRLLYDLLAPLADLPPSEWAMGQVGYVIWSR